MSFSFPSVPIIACRRNLPRYTPARLDTVTRDGRGNPRPYDGWRTARSFAAAGAGGAASVDEQVRGADGDGDGDEERGGDVWVNGCVEIVEEKWAVVGRDAGAGFAPVLGDGERAGRRSGFGDDAPDDGGNVESGKAWASTGEERAENHPGDVQEMRGERGIRECQVCCGVHASVNYMRDDCMR